MARTIGNRRTALRGGEPTTGELLITKIARAKQQGELIKDAAEIIYTPRKAGVVIGHDITQDKWLLRAAAKTTLDVDKLEAREKLLNPTSQEGGGDEAAQVYMRYLKIEPSPEGGGFKALKLKIRTYTYISSTKNTFG